MYTFPFVSLEFSEEEAHQITQQDAYDSYSIGIWNALQSVDRQPSTLYLIDHIEYDEPFYPFHYHKKTYAYDSYRYVLFYKTFNQDFYNLCFSNTPPISIIDKVQSQYELEQEIPILPESLRTLIYSLAEEALRIL